MYQNILAAQDERSLRAKNQLDAFRRFDTIPAWCKSIHGGFWANG